MEFDIPTQAVPTMEFQTRMGSGAALNVNKDDRTVDDVLIMRAGEADGHGFSVERSFLEALVKFANNDLGGRVQCNMGHRYDANFFQLGRFSGLYLSADGTEVRAKKLEVYKAADKSPALEGMADWFLDLAEEDAQAVMCSIKFVMGSFYQYDDKGRKVIIKAQWWQYVPEKEFKDKPLFVEFKRLLSCDIVDQGALTDTLFSADGPNHLALAFAQIVNAPGFEEWLSKNEDHFPKLQGYFQNKFKFNLGRFFSGIFTKSEIDMSKETNLPPAKPETTDTPPPDVTETSAEVSAEQLAELQKQLTKLQSDLTSRDTQIEALNKKVEELSDESAANPTGVANEDPSNVETTSKSYLNNPIFQQARRNAGHTS